MFTLYVHYVCCYRLSVYYVYDLYRILGLLGSTCSVYNNWLMEDSSLRSWLVLKQQCVHKKVYWNLFWARRLQSHPHILLLYSHFQYDLLDGPGVESLWGRDFSHRSRPALGSTASLAMGNGSFSEVKRPGSSVDPHLHLASRLKKEKGYTSTLHLGLLGLI